MEEYEEGTNLHLPPQCTVKVGETDEVIRRRVLESDVTAHMSRKPFSVFIPEGHIL